MAYLKTMIPIAVFKHAKRGKRGGKFKYFGVLWKIFDSQCAVGEMSLKTHDLNSVINNY